MVMTSEAEYRDLPAPSFEGEPVIPSKTATEKTPEPTTDDPPSDPLTRRSSGDPKVVEDSGGSPWILRSLWGPGGPSLDLGIMTGARRRSEDRIRTVREKYSMKILFQLPALRFLPPGSGFLPPGQGPFPRVWVPASSLWLPGRMKIYAHCSTSTTRHTGSGHDLQLISRVPPCSLKHIDTSCSLQHIDRSTICSGHVTSRTNDSYQLQSPVLPRLRAY
ncbi:hypothetical protein F2Q69_00006850 [Brassica cretica]|uniref:Uncharacterized protein n=1 Tax=Brassica cretica TaxID=69181 RepID=A0A8S9PA21_BRACR|nr:hypothetical protein F2Q69_00006850 [Brassica cretica]